MGAPPYYRTGDRRWEAVAIAPPAGCSPAALAEQSRRKL